jgi:hypothetical protein
MELADRLPAEACACLRDPGLAGHLVLTEGSTSHRTPSRRQRSTSRYEDPM